MSASQQKWWAILIGINAYPEGIRTLKGCIRDVEDVEEYVRNAAGASNMDIDVAKFTDESLSSPPTYENISRAFDRVSKQVASNDVVYFHFSGHGGRQWRTPGDQHPDKRTMEPGYERYFESLVLLGGRHMKDYELGRHFDCLASKGATLFAVLDCCHSGGGDRTDDQDVRQVDGFLPADPLSQLPEEIVADDAGSAFRGASSPTSYWTRAREYTMLAACQPHQFAKEVKDDEGQTRGVLTLTLMASLRTLRRDGQHLTYKNLFHDINSRIQSRSFGQCPKIFGLDEREVFSSTTHSSCRQATVEDVSRSKIRIDKGEIQGVETKDVWAIYPRGAPNLDEPIAEISINRVEANHAYGQLCGVSPPETQTIEPGCPASLSIPKYGRLLHVFVENSDLRSQLSDQPDIGVKFHDDNYEVVVYHVRETAAGGHELTHDSGEPVRDAPLYEPGLSYVSRLHDFLKILAHYSRILNLSNAKNDLEGEFQVREMNNKTIVENNGYIELELINLRDKPPRTEAKHQNCQKSLYFNVLNLRPNKSVHLLTEQPDPTEPGNSTMHDYDLTIPDTRGDVHEVVDILKIIVTDKPVSLRNLATKEAWRDDEPELNDFDGVFRQILEEAGSGDGDGMSRNINNSSPSRAMEVKWQTCQLSFTVTRNN